MLSSLPHTGIVLEAADLFSDEVLAITVNQFFHHVVAIQLLLRMNICNHHVYTILHFSKNYIYYMII